jgi:hypothetical protein
VPFQADAPCATVSVPPSSTGFNFNRCVRPSISAIPNASLKPRHRRKGREPSDTHRRSHRRCRRETRDNSSLSSFCSSARAYSEDRRRVDVLAHCRKCVCRPSRKGGTVRKAASFEHIPGRIKSTVLPSLHTGRLDQPRKTYPPFRPNDTPQESM